MTNLYGVKINNESFVILWEGSVKEDGTPGEDYRKMSVPLEKIEELIRTMKEAQLRAI